MKILFKYFFDRFLCLIGDHDWTCAAQENIKPTKAQVENGLSGFLDYAKMYCNRCGYVYIERK